MRALLDAAGFLGALGGVYFFLTGLFLKGRADALGRELGLTPRFSPFSARLVGERGGCRVDLRLGSERERRSGSETISCRLDVRLPSKGSFKAIIIPPGVSWDFPVENLLYRLPRLARTRSYRAWGYPPVAVERFLAGRAKPGRFFGSSVMPARVVRLTPDLVRVKFSLQLGRGEALHPKKFGTLLSDAVDFATAAAEAPLL